MARSKNRNPRPVINKADATSRGSGAASPSSSMAAAAAAAATLSSFLPAELAAAQAVEQKAAQSAEEQAVAQSAAEQTVAQSAAPSVEPLVQPSAASSAAPSVAPSVAPSPQADDASPDIIVLTPAPILAGSPAVATPAVVVADRENKDDMRAATGNLSAGPAEGGTVVPSTTPCESPSVQGASYKTPPTAMVCPPPPKMSISSVSVPAPARVNKGKGKAPLVAIMPGSARMQTTVNRGTAAVSATTAQPPRGPIRTGRQLYIAGPKAGSKPFATLQFRNTAVDWSRVRSGGSAAGAGRSGVPLFPASLNKGYHPGVAELPASTAQMQASADRAVVSTLATQAANIVPGGLAREPIAVESSLDGEGDGQTGRQSGPPGVHASVEPIPKLLRAVRARRSKRTVSPHKAARTTSAADRAVARAPPSTESPTATPSVTNKEVPASRTAAKTHAKTLENDINVTLDALAATVTDVEARMDDLAESSLLIDEKLDAAINLTQQTLMQIATLGDKLSKELKDGFYRVRFVLSGTVNANGDEAPEQTIERGRKILREYLGQRFNTALTTAETYRDTNAYWELAVRALASALGSGTEGAEVFLRSTVHLPSRRDPSIFIRTRASIPVLRVKSHMHKWFGELVWAAFVACLMPVGQVVTVEIATQLRAQYRYVLSPMGKKACVAATAKLFIMSGAADRVKEPIAAGDPAVVEATLGHFSFVTMKVRNMVERIAGERSVPTVGGDGHYSMWVEEVRFLHERLPKDSNTHDGLRLVDGASSSRALPDVRD